MEILDKGRRENDDAEVTANALLTSSWLLIDQKQYARALDEVRAAQKALADRQNHSLLVLADLIGGVAEIRAGHVSNAFSRLASLKSRYDSDDRVESNWVAALEGEIALAQGQYDQASSSFKAAQKQAWLTLGRDASTVFAINLPSRDGLARVEAARGNRAAAIETYRRLTAVGPSNRTSAALEPRYILELARLLKGNGNDAAARVEHERFLVLWANADAGLPELAEAKQALAATR
jgi:tetratricopeptide (TPR) repeat protein